MLYSTCKCHTFLHYPGIHQMCRLLDQHLHQIHDNQLNSDHESTKHCKTVIKYDSTLIKIMVSKLNILEFFTLKIPIKITLIHTSVYY